jgi:LAO/AO transport system kinase
MTGEGVPELLEAIDRRLGGMDTEARTRVRGVRAEAQVWAILVERIRGRLLRRADGGAAAPVLEAVVERRLDPYAAADQLLATLEGQLPD